MFKLNNINLLFVGEDIKIFWSLVSVKKIKVLWHFLYVPFIFIMEKSLNCLNFIVYNIAVIDYKQKNT